MVMGMKYEQLYAWTKLVGVINNRVSLINWLLVAGDGSRPCVVCYRRGRYRVLLGGSEYLSYRVYDVGSAESAVDRLTALYDGLWLARRSSCSFTLS